jgi:hypothetical protein
LRIIRGAFTATVLGILAIVKSWKYALSLAFKSLFCKACSNNGAKAQFLLLSQVYAVERCMLSPISDIGVISLLLSISFRKLLKVFKSTLEMLKRAIKEYKK